MAFKDDRAALTELLTVKFHGNNSMKEHIMLYKTPIHVLVCKLKENAKRMFCYLNFCCYFEADGQNHIHFQLIHVLKNSMA